jgi:hypothetical protein
MGLVPRHVGTTDLREKSMEYFQVNEPVPCLKSLRTQLLLNALGIQKVRSENKEYLNTLSLFFLQS